MEDTAKKRKEGIRRKELYASKEDVETLRSKGITYKDDLVPIKVAEKLLGKISKVKKKKEHVAPFDTKMSPRASKGQINTLKRFGEHYHQEEISRVRAEHMIDDLRKKHKSNKDNTPKVILKRSEEIVEALEVKTTGVARHKKFSGVLQFAAKKKIYSNDKEPTFSKDYEVFESFIRFQLNGFDKAIGIKLNTLNHLIKEKKIKDYRINRHNLNITITFEGLVDLSVLEDILKLFLTYFSSMIKYM